MAKTTVRSKRRASASRTTKKIAPKSSLNKKYGVVTAIALTLLTIGVGLLYFTPKSVTYESPKDLLTATDEIDCSPAGVETIATLSECEPQASVTTSVSCDEVPTCPDMGTLAASSMNRPPANYGKVSYRGKTFTKYTVVLLKRAEANLKTIGVKAPSYVQGSFTTGASASAATHARGGAVDVSLRSVSSANQLKVLKAYRQAGFAAWIRTPADGFTLHIHAIAIGDKSAHPQALSQVRSYLAGKNGLANNKADRYAKSVGKPIPAWAKNLKLK